VSMTSLTASGIEYAKYIKWAGISLLFFGLGAMTLFVASDPQNFVLRGIQQYTVYLERKLRLLFVWTPGRVIVFAQVAAIFVVLLFAALFGLRHWFVFVGLILVGPAVVIERMRRKRVLAIEQQLDGFLMSLANALKSTPSLGDAFVSIQRLIPYPMRDEVELAAKEMRIGSTLEQALLVMAGRIGSRQVDSALSAILIGRQIGGNLPRVLDATAAALREMARLEGVVRTKTAEGKTQLWVLALFPLVLMVAFNAVKEGYFAPLTQSFIGYLLVVVALMFWVASIIVARNILDVDI
jgi:tight adherence protein B